MQTNSSPAQMIEQARIGTNPQALGNLIAFYRDYLKLLAQLQIGHRLESKVDASDIVQEVALRASHGFPQFRGDSEQEFLSWIRRILSTVLAKSIRTYYGTSRRNARLERQLEEQLEHTSGILQRALLDDAPSPSEQASTRERAVLLATAMERLPEDYRRVIMLRHFEQLSFPDVAKRLGRTLDSVKNIWPRALVALRRDMKALE